MAGRTLPHNSEAEAAILGGIILRGDQALLDVLDVVREEDFYVPSHQAVFRAMRALSEKREPIDTVTLEAQLRASDELKLVGGIEALSRLADRYATSRNITHHAEMVRRTATIRNLVVVTKEIAEEGMGDLEAPDEFIDQAEKRVLEVNERGRKTGYVSSRDLLIQVFNQISERAKRKNPITGVPTGFTQLDHMTGGLQPGDLVIIAARPSMGKTAFVLNLAQSACIMPQRFDGLPDGERPVMHPVLFFSLEMGASQLVERVLCAEARVDAGKLRTGNYLEEEWIRMTSAASRIAQSKFYIDDQAAPSILEMRARARRFKDDKNIFPGIEGQFGMIIVDYLQLARGGKSRYDSREQEISEISRGLKAMAKELRMPVLALSQLNRAVDTRADHKPQLSDLRESGAIEQDADVIMFIYRAERYAATEDEKKKVENQAEIIIGKQRNGPIGEVQLMFIKHMTRFENPAEPGFHRD
ncbi:replicative DNA helicase [Nannocystis bainbridge]|uniref:Replicative DNA helicase n=1 Tax=Nannocystis bainbridge TaxID=2995303 RepID=A0ABT5E1H8_9BACT|nr:replicative DNA helicase [Nannocystis bainbridge]MDC0718833.1 replicative DNA helicase [Nannocystis bainbridge]